MSEQTTVHGTTRPCCADLTARRVIEQRRVFQHGLDTVSTTTQCKVCGAKHYLLEVPPIDFGLSGAALG